MIVERAKGICAELAALPDFSSEFRAYMLHPSLSARICEIADAQVAWRCVSAAVLAVLRGFAFLLHYSAVDLSLDQEIEVDPRIQLTCREVK